MCRVTGQSLLFIEDCHDVVDFAQPAGASRIAHKRGENNINIASDAYHMSTSAIPLLSLRIISLQSDIRRWRFVVAPPRIFNAQTKSSTIDIQFTRRLRLEGRAPVIGKALRRAALSFVSRERRHLSADTFSTFDDAERGGSDAIRSNPACAQRRQQH